MDYPVQLTSQLRPLLKSLRKSRQMTQAELARRLGVVQSRIADIERDPGAVSVEQLLQVLAMLGAQVVVRQTERVSSASQQRIDLEAHAGAPVTLTAAPTPDPPPDSPPDDAPRAAMVNRSRVRPIALATEASRHDRPKGRNHG